MILYIANKNYSSWSLRPWVLMRELGISFQEKLFPFGGETAFETFSPSGKVPCLIDGETVVWDSLSIVEYLAEDFPGVWPADKQVRAWARSAAAEMHSGLTGLRMTCPMNCGVRVRIESIPNALVADLARLDKLWNDGFSRFGGPYLAGQEFTAVDAFFAPVAFRIQTYALELSERSLQYVDRLLALPSMQEWYFAALEEIWRDERHDEEIFQAGILLADLRRPQSEG
ncbi:MAG: glutathione S-transferase family protein [Desulfuromonadales bacterium]|nr:glutathione S-transferase family protein [Desulfuromonadales bacterium]